MRKLIALAMLAVLGLSAGCMTGNVGYSSNVVVTPLSGKDQFKMSVKVLKIEKVMGGGTNEIVLYSSPTSTWEKGEPQQSEVTTGDGKTTVQIKAFVPKDNQGSVTYEVQVQEKGIVQMQSQIEVKPPQ